MYAPPAAYRETIERVRALPVRMLASGPRADPPRRDGRDVPRRQPRGRATGSPQLVADALDEAPRTLLELCGRVHAAYGGLPDERVADLALTVDGHLAELIAAGRAEVASDNPRRFRSRA